MPWQSRSLQEWPLRTRSGGATLGRLRPPPKDPSWRPSNSAFFPREHPEAARLTDLPRFGCPGNRDHVQNGLLRTCSGGATIGRLHPRPKPLLAAEQARFFPTELSEAARITHSPRLKCLGNRDHVQSGLLRTRSGGATTGWLPPPPKAPSWRPSNSAFFPREHPEAARLTDSPRLKCLGNRDHVQSGLLRTCSGGATTGWLPPPPKDPFLAAEQLGFFPWGRSETATRPGLLRDFEFAGRSLPRNFRPCSDTRGQAGRIAASERPL
jgi:hypothetical protein